MTIPQPGAQLLIQCWPNHAAASGEIHSIQSDTATESFLKSRQFIWCC